MCHYLLGTGESYSPTAQHMQDSPIFFIQLNYVHNNNKNKVLPPYGKFPCHKVAQHWEFHILFLNSAILHSCNFRFFLHFLREACFIFRGCLFMPICSYVPHMFVHPIHFTPHTFVCPLTPPYVQTPPICPNAPLCIFMF